ncbi:MAG: PAS domain S-box protein, partial [Gemmatimonadaceae bacterium]
MLVHSHPFPAALSLTEILLMIAAGIAAAVFIAVVLPKQWRGIAAEPRRSHSRILAEHVVDMVSTHAADGTFRYVSPVFAGMVGESPHRLVGRSPREFAHPEDVSTLDGLWPRAVWTEAAASTIWRCRQQSGEYSWLETTGRAATGEAANLGEIICASRDITERKQLEDALRESEQRFRTTIETVRLVAVGLDSNANVTFCNDALCTLTGWKRHELMGANWFDRCVAPDDPVRAQFYENIATGEIPSRQEYEMICRDGTHRMIQWDNTVLRSHQDVLGTASLGADVTDARKEEETLKLLQSITLAISSARDLDAALRLTLESICQAAGWGYGEAWLPSEDGTHLERTTYYAANGVKAGPLVQDGKRLTFELSEGLPGLAWQSHGVVAVSDIAARALPRSQQALDCGFNASVTLPVLSGPDVAAVLVFLMEGPRPADARFTQMIQVAANQIGTAIERRREQREYEAEILRARDAAQAASQAKSEFLSRMSHELRTPLNSVIGFANVLRKNKGGRLAQEDVTYLDRIA